MGKKTIILVVENNQRHFSLIKKSLERGGIWNEKIRFAESREMLDFLFMRGDGLKREAKKEYVLLLDILSPKVDGLKTLEEIKQDRELKKIPVIILTTADDIQEIDRCHSLGCSIYIVKPAEQDSFADAIKKIGLFLSIIKVPQINGEV